MSDQDVAQATQIPIPPDEMTAEQRTQWLDTAVHPTKPEIAKEIPAPQPKAQEPEVEAKTESAQETDEGHETEEEKKIEETTKVSLRALTRAKTQREVQRSRADSAEARADRLERELAELRGGETTKVTPVQEPPETPKPTQDKFDTYDEFIEALADWKADQRVSKALSEREATQKAEEQKKSEARQQTEQAEVWKKRVDAALAVPGRDDFREVAFGKIPMSVVMRDAILDSELGAEVLYALGKNPAEAQRIAGLGPMAAAREIWKLELTLTSRSSSKPPEKQKQQVSSAPDPITPVGSNGTGGGAIDPAKDYPGWERQENEKIAAARARR